MPAHILVAGGGIGGLASALALAQRGHRVDVFEQAEAFGEIGAGVQLGPNATRRLQALGLTRALSAIAAQPEALIVRNAANGDQIGRLPLGAAMHQQYGAPYFCVHRADLHAMLLGVVRSRAELVSLSTGARIAQIETDTDLVRVSSSDARAWRGDALIGADGLWSVVRERLVVPPAMPAAPRRTGHTAWRALVRQADLPKALRRQQVEVWLGARLHAVTYPVRRGEWLNVVVIAEAAGGTAAAETSRAAGEPFDLDDSADARAWDQASSLARLQHAIGACAGALPALLEAMPQWRAWTLHDRAPLSSPGEMARERIALLGDAAHPMLPYLAQGAGMAIEDALALATALGEGGPAEVPAALLRYAQARWQRNAQVQMRARRNGHIFHATGPMRWGRDVAMRLFGARLLDQPWLYSA